MSSRANGCMIVILPKDKVKDFEGYFDAQNDYAFINTEIELAESVDSDIVGYERRVYDVSCCYSLESCLIEPRDNNIQDVCYNLGLQYLDIDAENSIENFNENIIFENGRCSYATKICFQIIIHTRLRAGSGKTRCNRDKGVWGKAYGERRNFYGTGYIYPS